MNNEIRYTYTGVVNAELVAGAINWLSNQAFQNTAKKLKFFISSTGGDVDSAFRLHDYLKALPFAVETIGFGQIDSAANIIFLAGEKRSAVKECRFFLHEGTFTVGQQVSALHVHQESLKLLEYIYKRHVKLIAEETHHKEKEIADILRKGVVLSSEEAIEFGLLHEIIEKIPLPEVV